MTLARLVICALLCVALSPHPGIAQPPSHGLMWNRTGLPAVFPLQVKTNEGADYFVTLIDAETDQPAMAAYIEGGRFFKLLVPPGLFHVSFASGKTWRGEDALFGPDTTKKFSLAEPLHFAVRDAATKAGHIIDMTQSEDKVIVGDIFTCKRFALTRVPRPQAPFDDTQGYATRLTGPGEMVQFPNRNLPDSLSEGVVEPIIPTDFAPYLSNPTFDVVRRPC